MTRPSPERALDDTDGADGTDGAHGTSSAVGRGAPTTVADLAVPRPRPAADVGPGARHDGAPLPPAGLDRADVPGLYTPEPTGRVDPLAAWSPIAAVLLPPLGVGAGLAALYRVRARRANGRGLAVAAVVVGSVVSAVLVLILALSWLVGTGSAASGPLAGGGAGGSACSGDVCTTVARGAPVVVSGLGATGSDGLGIVAIGDGSAAVASPQGPVEVPTGTAVVLENGTRVVLTYADDDTVVVVHRR